MTTAKSKTTDAKTAAEKIQAVGKETVETVMRTSAQATSKGFEQAVDMASGQVDAVVQGYDDIAGFNRNNLDAFVEAGTCVTKGVEAMNAEVMALAKEQMETSVKTVKALSGAKTAKDFMELQTNLMKNSYEMMMANSTKFAEMAMKISQDSMSPLTARASAFADEITAATKR